MRVMAYVPKKKEIQQYLNVLPQSRKEEMMILLRLKKIELREMLIGYRQL